MPKRVRLKKDGFVGVTLVKGGDRTLYERFMREVKADAELDQSKLVRLALKEYFDRKDGTVNTDISKVSVNNYPPN